MFLNQLTAAQKNSFLALTTRMVLADGEVAPEEDALLAAMKLEMGDKVTAPPEEGFGTTNPEPFDTRKSRYIVVMELLVMGYADDRFHPDESSVIEEVRETFELTDDEMGRIRDWAEREAKLIHEAHGMIGS